MNKTGLYMIAKIIIKKLIQAAIRTYQLFFVPLLPAGSCRFLPTCSHYAMDAIRLHGPIKGGWLTLKRISRCNPWGGMGADEVPPETQSTVTTTEHSTG
jgi:putative membrane protein insertion efficiency factor